MKARLLLCLSAVLLSQASAVNAQFEGWYQIEMIVFERIGGFDDEIWPTDITLRYPLDWQELKDPDAPATPPPTSAEELQAGAAQGSELAPATPRESAPVPPDLARMPFYTLPADQRVLNQDRRRLSAREDIRVLFHEAWRQPVAGADETPSVLIFGGEKFDKHSRLEGSVHITVSRYLHLHTNLWLSNFQVNTGQSHTAWPEIPLNPVERLKQTDLQADPFTATEPLLPASWTTEEQRWLQAWKTTELPDLLAAPYLPTRIVTLQQSRRMRSDELHYVDHPRLGLLIKILPYTLPPEAPRQEQPIEETSGNQQTLNQ